MATITAGTAGITAMKFRKRPKLVANKEENPTALAKSDTTNNDDEEVSNHSGYQKLKLILN